MKVFKINENTVKLLSCEEAATYAVISNAKTSDNTCYCYEKYIADKLNVTDRTVRNHVKVLSETGAFTITSENITDTTKRRNIYRFTNLNRNFIVVDASILDANLSNTEIGLLIKFKAECLNNSSKCYYSLNKLAAELHIGKSKLSKLLNSLIDKKIITKHDNHYELNLFFKSTSKNAVKADKTRKQQLEKWNVSFNKFSICNDKTGKLFKEYNLKLDTVTNPAALATAIISGCYGVTYKKKKRDIQLLKEKQLADIKDIIL